MLVCVCVCQDRKFISSNQVCLHAGIHYWTIDAVIMHSGEWQLRKGASV